MKKKTKSVDQWCAEKETEERSERGRERELVVRVERLKLGAESVVEVYRRTCGYVFEAHVGSAFSVSGKLKRIRFENVRVDCVGARVVMLS
jgi:hypothetical protein